MIFALAALLWSCERNDDDAQIAHRTVLVYMVADNSLGTSYGSDRDDLDEMLVAAKRGALRGGGRLLVYYNRPGTAEGKAPQLLEVTREGIVVRKTYPDDAAVYSVDPQRMEQVLDDVEQTAPATDYGLVLWSHAIGWLESPTSKAAPKRRSFGDDRGYSMKISSLARVLEGRRLSFIYFDCCLMGNVETIYELRHCAPMIVASPTELGIDGMPYGQNVPLMFKSTPDVVGMAKNTFEYYRTATDPRDRECQMAVYNTRAFNRLAAASRAVFELVDEYPVANYSLQRLGYDEYRSRVWSYDMADVMALLAKNSPELLAQWRAALESAVVYAATTPTGIRVGAVERYCGLGCYLVTSPFTIGWRGYSNTAWWRDVVSAAPAYAE